METLHDQLQANGHRPLIADLPGQVIVALDHLTSEDREGVFAAIHAFASDVGKGTRLSGSEPMYILRAAPEVRVIVRREPDAPVEVEDIVRPATLRNFADHVD